MCFNYMNENNFLNKNKIVYNNKIMSQYANILLDYIEKQKTTTTTQKNPIIQFKLNAEMSTSTGGVKVSNMNTTKINDTSPTSYTYSSGDFTIGPGTYRIHCMGTMLNKNSSTVERSSSIALYENTTELIRNSTGVDWLDSNNTAASVNLTYIYITESSKTIHIKALSDSQGSSFLTASFFGYIEKIS
jgi:hypothetical protein